MHAPPAVPDPGLHVLALFAEPPNAFGATRGAKPARFDSRFGVQCGTKGGFLASLLALIGLFYIQKPVRF
jgi:hypothetical protein